MGKITRFDPGNAPSSVVGGTPRPKNGLAEALTGAAQTAVDTGYAIAADSETEHAKRLHEATAAKQKIDDTVLGGVHTQNYEAASESTLVDFQDKFAADPTAGRRALAVQLNDDTLAHVEGASKVNLTLGQNAATDTERINASTLRKYDEWALAKTTQNIRINVDEMFNLAQANVEQFSGNGAAVEKLIDTKAEELGPKALVALGGKAASDKVANWKSEAAQAYYDRRSRHDFTGVIADLDATTGTAARFLNGDQRKAIRAKAESNLKEAPLNRQIDDLVRGTKIDNEVVQRLQKGELGEEIIDITRAAEANRDLILGDKSLGKAEKDTRLANIDDRIKFYNAAEALMLNQSDYDIQDKPGTAAEVIAAQAVLVHAKGSRVMLRKDSDLTGVVQQRTRIIKAMLGGAVPRGSGKAMLRQLDLALPSAQTKAQENDHRVLWFNLPWADSDQIGRRAIEDEFKARYPNATPAQMNDAQFRFTSAMVEASDKNGDLTGPAATRRALEAASHAMGKDPHGLFTGRAKKAGK